MENDHDSVGEFKTVLKAQSEAYLEFHIALINLLNNQKEILAKVDKHNIFTEEECKKINREINNIERIFKDFQTKQVTRDHDIEGSVDDFKATIDSFNDTLVEVVNEIKSIKKMQWDFKNLFSKITYSVGGIITFLTMYQLLTGKGIISIIK